MRRYDYVIVGAGSAGCVLAARLSADPDVKVALLEAGDEDSANEIRVPAATLQLAKTKYDWDFYSEAEPGLGGKSVPLARGKGIGGTSSINAMVYIRGNPADFDNWERGGASGVRVRPAAMRAASRITIVTSFRMNYAFAARICASHQIWF